jgi:hypothetical protein
MKRAAAGARAREELAAMEDAEDAALIDAALTDPDARPLDEE